MRLKGRWEGGGRKGLLAGASGGRGGYDKQVPHGSRGDYKYELQGRAYYKQVLQGRKGGCYRCQHWGCLQRGLQSRHHVNCREKRQEVKYK